MLCQAEHQHGLKLPCEEPLHKLLSAKLYVTRGVVHDHPPPSKCRGHERVEPYLYSTSGPQWSVIGRTLLSFYMPLQYWWPKFSNDSYFQVSVISNCIVLIRVPTQSKACTVFYRSKPRVRRLESSRGMHCVCFTSVNVVMCRRNNCDKRWLVQAVLALEYK